MSTVMCCFEYSMINYIVNYDSIRTLSENLCHFFMFMFVSLNLSRLHLLLYIYY